MVKRSSMSSGTWRHYLPSCAGRVFLSPQGCRTSRWPAWPGCWRKPAPRATCRPNPEACAVSSTHSTAAGCTTQQANRNGKADEQSETRRRPAIRLGWVEQTHGTAQNTLKRNRETRPRNCFEPATLYKPALDSRAMIQCLVFRFAGHTAYAAS